MTDDSSQPKADLGRWLFIAILILGGVVLFFIYGTSTNPVPLPSEVEAPR